MKNKNNLYIYIIILVLIVIFGLLVYCNRKLLETYESNPKIWTLSFGGGGQNFYDALNRISEELSRTNIFDEIVKFTDIDLKKDSEFWRERKDFIEKNKRGYGYWLWKPYLIKKTLDKMNEGDILLYLDSGCEVKNDNNNKLKELLKKCEKFNILYTSTGKLEKEYTKMDIFSRMNMISGEVLNSIQHQACVLFIKKNDNTTSFINDWYSIACNYNLIDDSSSILSNDSSFVENRHDQSIFSLLVKSDKYKNDMNTPNNLIDDTYPIVASRKRHG